jgi:hypothetical protein
MVNIVEHLVQQGLVVRHGGEWTLLEGVEAEVTSLPEGLRQMLGGASRLSRRRHGRCWRPPVWWARS